MKILHTSDWHLGKRLMERERLPEQIEVLDEIVAICEEKGVELVLVAGDVFDTHLPPAEAEEAFFRAVRMLAGKDRAVVVIAGNHDDAVRLAAAAPLAAEEGIYLFGDHTFPHLTESGRAVHAVAAGENYIIVQNAAGERVYLNTLSYPGEARLREEKTEETYAEKTARWIAAGDAAYDGEMTHILVSHLFAAGGTGSESERDISLGGARAVPLANFSNFDYVALGHLHKMQRFGDRIAYSGSILQYSFDEAGMEKCVLLLQTAKHAVAWEKIALRGGKRLVRLEANGVEEAVGLLAKYPGHYVELTLFLDAPLSTNETQTLREANAGLISLQTRVKENADVRIVRRSEMDAEALFREYYRMKMGAEPSDELKEAFLRLLGEGA